VPLPSFDHVCQLFDSVESHSETVAPFLAEGLRSGDYVIAAARPMHWTAIAARLEALGVSVAEEIGQGRLVLYDAARTLAQFGHRGRINSFAFNELIGAAVRPAEGRRVRAWGEMVDLLAERGDIAGSIELEELWNGVGEMVPMTLRCSYSAAHFVQPSTHRAVRDICALHTDVQRDPADPLANWILTTAHRPSGSSLTH
jgi:hypothetical protein